MIYRVVIDSIDFLDYTDPELTLLSPRLDMEVNTAGSLEFTIPPYHKHYDKVKILVSTVEVYEDGELIWYGRPVEQVIDFYKQKKIYCEGPLSFFNDSVQIKMEFESIRLSEYFAYLIRVHNAEVTNNDRRFQVGHVTIADSNVYRKLDYQSSYDALKGTCLDTVDGYFFFRRENGQNYIDWVKNIPYSSNQELKFGINLLDYQSDFDASDFATGVLALGKDQGNGQGPLTLAGVNNGQEVLLSEAASTYGRIVKIQNWSDIKDASELLSEAHKYLSNLQFNSLVIECSAVDLHYFNPDYNIYKLGQNVHVYSDPHLIDKDYPISKISISLDSASKQITLGTIKRKTLTRIYKEDKEDQDNMPTDEDTGGYDPGGTMPDDTNGWEIVMPEKDGDPITAIRLPTHIVITRPPSKTVYKSGDRLDYTGIMVSIRTTDKDGNDSSWTNPPRYIDGTVPFGELSFPTTLAPVMQPGATDFQVTVVWNYKSKRYVATLDLSIEEEKELEHWTANYIKRDAGILGENRGRTYAKKNAEKAIAVWCVNWSSSGWEGPILISDNIEACVYTVNETTVLQPLGPFTYQGMEFYLNMLHHWGTHKKEGNTSLPIIEADPTVTNTPQALFNYMASRCGLHVNLH